MIDILYNNCTLKEAIPAFFLTSIILTRLYRRGLICKKHAAYITLVTTCSLNKSK